MVTSNLLPAELTSDEVCLWAVGPGSGAQSLNSPLMTTSRNLVETNWQQICAISKNRKQMATSGTNGRGVSSLQQRSIPQQSLFMGSAPPPGHWALEYRGGNESLNSLSSADNSRPFPKRQLIPKSVQVGQDSRLFMGSAPSRALGTRRGGAKA